ncbi:MAG: hypothetical protein ACYTFG_19475 [Planctomycetota bacterium]
MVLYHGFSEEEVQAATGLGKEEIAKALERFGIEPDGRPERGEGDPLVALPYPGGRHPRIGFLEGAIDPQRETKVSVFAPWDEGRDYVVVDVPEAIRWQHGILYLAHTHVPTAWTEKGIELEPTEWVREKDGVLRMERTLPNGVSFGTVVTPKGDHVRMDMWLRNGGDETLTDMRVQNCAMLKGMPGFDQLTKENKIFEGVYAACHNEDKTRWIINGFDPILRGWGNAKCPCLHADPQFPDCAPGEKVEIKGWVSFYEGTDISAELERIEATGWRGE